LPFVYCDAILPATHYQLGALCATISGTKNDPQSRRMRRHPGFGMPGQQEQPMTETYSFGNWVRRRRKALDLTQAALAAQVGCAEVTIRRIEADERRPSRQIAALLAELLKLPPEQQVAFIAAARAELGADRLAPAPVPPDVTPEAVAPAPAPVTAAISASPSLLPSGMATFLFTDIEGSTPVWEREPDQMRLALARHHAILRMAIATEGGHAYKTIGDAFQAAFALPIQALAAALAAQRALAIQTWETSEPIRVRMGIHVGPAKVEGNDYSTTHTLNRVARIMAAGHGGQILLSREVADLVRCELPADVTLRDMGTHRMKGLTHLEHLFQLVAPDLPTAFPPLKSLDQHPTNLPLQSTLLIGRENEIASVCSLLRRADIRLVTLTGPGGTGKTRLALQSAAELVDDFGDGVWFINLAPISDLDLVATTIAQTLGVRETGSRPLRDSLQDYLREKQLLLLLDNFEQVVDAAPLAAELLATAPALKILVTSRIALHLSGEHEMAVPPLGLPDRTDPPSLQRLTQYEAVRLFIERAQAVNLAFEVTNTNAPAVAEICHQLDGLPLAIELAAARSKLFAPQALLVRLGNRLKLLTGGTRDLPARQQTIRNTIDWSYNLLDAAQQTLFVRLGVFVGGWTEQAAEAVCNAAGDVPIDMLDGLAALLDQSLLRQAEGADSEPRFTMLETIREYALERLEASGEVAALRRHHAAYYLGLAEQAEPELDGEQQRVWLTRLRQDYDNLRAALGWIIEQDAAELGVRLVDALDNFWFLAGYISEGRRWATALVALARATWPAELRAQVLRAVGWMAWQQGDYAAALEVLEESAVLYRQLGDRRSLVRVLNPLSRALLFQGEHARARMLLEECTALSREVGDHSELAMSLLGQASLAMDQADYAAARSFLEQSLPIYRTLGEPWGIGLTVNYLGDVARCEGHYEQAAAHYQESLTLFRTQGIQVEIAAILHNLGYAVLAMGDQQRARAYFGESLTLQREQGSQTGILEGLAGFGALLAAQGQPRRAAILFGAVAALRATLGAPMWPAERVEYERHLAGVRAALGEGALQAALGEGHAFSLEQAIAEALRVPLEARPTHPSAGAPV
jgi:predicted ATPase/class 3 adenylate cyclase